MISDKYKWKKDSIAYLSGATIRASDRPAISIDQGYVIINNCNIQSYYGHNTKNKAYLCDVENARVNMTMCHLALESYGYNEVISAIYGKGSDTEIIADNCHFEIKRVGADSYIYLLNNHAKKGKLEVHRSHIIIDDDSDNKVEKEYISEDAGATSVLRSNIITEKSRNASHNPSHSIDTSGRWNSTETPVIKNSNNTRLIRSDSTLATTDNFILITAEQKTIVTLPELSGPKAKELTGSIASIVYIIKSTKEYINHSIIVSGSNRINELDKQIILDNTRTLHIRSVGSDWISW